MLRVTNDIWDEQSGIDQCFEAWRKWQGKERPGFWIDMDMIPFGQLQLMSPRGWQEDPMKKGDIALAGKGTRRWCQLDEAQKRMFITLRALAASPLMIGGDLPSMDEYSLTLLTNQDMLACNQNGVMGQLISDEMSVEVWRAFTKNSQDAGWAGVFNRSDDTRTVVISPALLGLKRANRIKVWNVWEAKSLTLTATEPCYVTIQPHDVVFLRFGGPALSK
jgi:alpha-galactosidase